MKFSAFSLWQDTHLLLDLVTQQRRLKSHDMFLLPLQPSPWQPCLQLPPATGQTQNSKTKRRISHPLLNRSFSRPVLCAPPHTHTHKYKKHLKCRRKKQKKQRVHVQSSDRQAGLRWSFLNLNCLFLCTRTKRSCDLLPCKVYWKLIIYSQTLIQRLGWRLDIWLLPWH